MRYSMLSLAVLATTTSSVLANDVVSLFLPMMDEQPVDGKIIGTKGSLTSYVLYCAPETPSESCGLPQEGYTIAQGPSSYAMSYSYEDYYATQDCKFLNKSVVSCKVTMSDATTTQITSAAVTTDHMPFLPVTITATETGEKAAATKPATTKDAPSNTAATATSSAKASTAIPSSTGTPASTSAPASSSSAQAATSSVASGAAASQTITDNAAAAATGSAMQWMAAGGAAMGVVLALV